MIDAVILSTGDELTTGRTTDTNSSFIADRLFALGIDVVAILTVGDRPERLRWAWSEALRLGHVVIGTGGLGPTADDLTTETVAAVLGRPLEMDTAVADNIRQLFARFNRTMPENNLKQATFPVGAVIIPNLLGTAPGYRLEVGAPDDRRHLVVLPGVPREMKSMLGETVIPWLAGFAAGARVSHRTFQTFGISESALDEAIAGIPGGGRWSFRANFPEISVRVTLAGDDLEGRLEAMAREVYARLGPHVYGEGDTTLEATVGELLRQRGVTVGLAESCTGGLITHRLTNVPGSSGYVRGGVVAYANEVKQQQLAVRPDILETFGAVSEEAAAAMAEGARRALAVDIAVASTGIAGPAGGTPEKPVGTVCLALAAASGTVTRRYQLWGNREWVKLLTSQIALDWMRRHVLGLPILDLGRPAPTPVGARPMGRDRG